MTRLDIERLVHGSDRPCLALDPGNRVVLWNRPLAWLVGLEEAEVVDRELGKVVVLRDVFGNRCCSRLCALHEMVRAGEVVHPFEIDFRKPAGDYLRMRAHVVTLLAAAGRDYRIVLSLEEMRRRRASDGTRGEPETPRAPSPPDVAERPDLTRREVQILRLLARGETTRKMASELGISEATVRNHVQRVLAKLDVRHRAAAVAVALKNRLV